MAKKSTGPILLVDSPERCADLRYASDFWAPDPLVFLDHGTRRVLLVSGLELGRAQALAARTPGGRLTVATPDSLGLKGRQRRSLGEWALALLRHEGVRAVRVPPGFPLGTAERLRARGCRVTVEREALYPRRAVKTPVELARIAECQRAAVAALGAVVARLRAAPIGPDGALRDGRGPLTAEAVKAAIHTTLLARGAWCRDVIVAGGAAGADPHARGTGALRAGEAIVIDIFPQHMEHGYWGDLTRTVVRGRASPALRRQYRAVRAAHTAALAAVRAGAPVARVHAAAADTLTARGFENASVDGRPEGFIHSTGHGVGLEIHEAPAVAPLDGRLKAGQVITIEPGLYYRATGGVRIEDTVVVTRDGYQLLARAPYHFEL